MEPEAVLDGLDPEQRAVAEAVSGPVCVLAGAGTGKTRAITHRIAYAVLTGLVAPQRVLAVTFTTRAAGELRGRLRGLGAPGVQARTFHSAALRQLTYFWPRVIGGPSPKIIESKIGLVAEAARACRLSFGRPELRDVAAEIEWAKTTQTRPGDYPAAARQAGRRPPLDAPDVGRTYEAYESLRRERNLLDFEGMLELTAAMIAEHREVATAVREQYRYFVVDEFQDVNPLQRLLLDAWLGDRDDLCVVGDPNQTIYSFTGASASYLLEFTARYPAARVVRLARDYRSTPQVVGLANGVLKNAGGASPGEAGRLRGVELIAQREAGPEPEFTEHDDEVAEARDVATRIGKLIAGGTPAREIAVLYRVNAQSEAYEQAFADAGIAHVVRGAERFFDRPEVRQAIVLLRGAARSADDTEAPLATTVRHILASAGFTDRPPEGGGAARDRWESLAALVQLAETMTADAADADAGRPAAAPRPRPGLAEFAAELEERATAQHAPPLEGVTLASLHAAKGLEWDAVFLVGLVEGTMPIIYAETAAQLEEERRLLYVGVTRARVYVYLSWALARSPGGRRGRRRSRFLDGMAPHTATPPRAVRAGRRARTGPQPCRVCGRPLTASLERKLGRCQDCPADLDEGLFAALKTWRLEASRTQRVPAFVIFTDATLQAIAEHRPMSADALTEIPGVGKVKLERYGEAVLALCRGEEPPPILVD